MTDGVENTPQNWSRSDLAAVGEQTHGEVAVAPENQPALPIQNPRNDRAVGYRKDDLQTAGKSGGEWYWNAQDW